jgi:hypothetical protein
MKTSAKVALLTVLVAIPAFLLGNGAPGGAWWKSVWPWTQSHGDPPANLLPFFLFLAVVEAVSLGLAISFIVWGWPAMKRLSGGRSGLATAMYVSATWLLGNWWMHDNLHQVNGFDFTGLLAIEYLFHVTLIAAGAVLCYGLATSALDPAGPSPSAD